MCASHVSLYSAPHESIRLRGGGGWLIAALVICLHSLAAVFRIGVITLLLLFMRWDIFKLIISHHLDFHILVTL